MKLMKKRETMLSEWSHRVDAAGIGLTPLRTTISASPQERKDLARRLQVESVDVLKAELVLARKSENLVLHVTGSFSAQVTQPCVVTLEPVQQQIEGSVEGWFADPDSVVPFVRAKHERNSKKAGAELPILEEEDAPEALINGEVDLGELVTQHLSLALDPYPHKEGVDFEYQDKPSGEKRSKTRENPFAALKNWKKGQK